MARIVVGVIVIAVAAWPAVAPAAPAAAAAPVEAPRLWHYEGDVRSLGFSSDGRTLVSAAWPGERQWDQDVPVEVRTWDWASGVQKSSVTIEPRVVACAAVSPDGALVATGGGKYGEPGEVALWEVSTGRRVRLVGEHPPVGEDQGTPRALAFSPDGSLLATAGASARLWKTATGAFVRDFGPGKVAGLSALAFSPDGRTLAWGSGVFAHLCGPEMDTVPRGEVRLFDVDSGKLQLELKDPRQPAFAPGVSEIVFSPDGGTLAVRTSVVRTWERRTGKLLHTFYQEGKQYVTPSRPNGSPASLAFTADGKRLGIGVRAHVGGHVELWDRATGGYVATLGGGHRRGVASLRLSPDGLALASGGGGVRVWDLRPPPPRPRVTLKPRAVLKGHSDAVRSVAFSPDGKALASAAGSHDPEVWLWDPATGRRVRELRGLPGGAASVAFARGGRTVVAGGGAQEQRGFVAAWDAATGKLEQAVAAHQKPVQTVAVSPAGDRLLTVSYDNTAKLWEWAGGGLRMTHRIGGVNGTTMSCAAAFSPDGATAYAGRGEAKLVDVASGRVSDLPGTPGGSVAAAFSPDGRILALARVYEGLPLASPATGRVREVLPVDAYGVTFSPDGRLLISGNDGGKVTVWAAKLTWPTAAPWTQELATATGHEERVRAVAVSPDGKTLATGSDDRTIVLWDLLVTVPDGHQP